MHSLMDSGLPVTDKSVPTAAFCDYLYKQITQWRTSKAPALWPWRAVIAGGRASERYLQGILLENYHYVHASAVRQSPRLSHACSGSVFDLLRDFVTEEAAHERYFEESLTRWGIPVAAIRQSAPLTSTAEFIALQYRMAHTSILDYLAGSAVLEVDPHYYRDHGDPYEPWEKTYHLDPEILAPVREHIRQDVEAGHASLFRLVALETAPVALPVDIATSAFQSARHVFVATRHWQRDIFEHYQADGSS